jgi:type IV secretion system protein VirB6
MNCVRFSADAPAGIAAMLRSVDCATGQATAFAFDRLFGAHGALATALTALLTIYVALLAFNLLAGRSSLSLSLLTPRALTLGLVLTFATSWVAYQHVVWNLAAGAPDEIARLLIGSKGSATDMFAVRLDHLFTVVTDAAGAGPADVVVAGAAPAAGAATVAATNTPPVKPSDLLWYAGMLLLLGTAGVLIVARIALAAMLAIGPIFILLALFDATRGLFEGWVRSTMLFAMVPLLTVLLGGGALLLMAPLVQPLTIPGAVPTLQQAIAIFLGACVYVALMIMSLKAASVLTGGWRLPSFKAERRAGDAIATASIRAQTDRAGLAATNRDERIHQIVAASQPPPLSVAIAGQPARPGAPIPAFSVTPSGSRERIRDLGGFASRTKVAQ